MTWGDLDFRDEGSRKETDKSSMSQRPVEARLQSPSYHRGVAVCVLRDAAQVCQGSPECSQSCRTARRDARASSPGPQDRSEGRVPRHGAPALRGVVS